MMMDENAFIDCTHLSCLVNEHYHNLLLICDTPKPSQCDFLIRHTVNEHAEVQLINRLAESVKAQHTTDIVVYGLSNHPRFVQSALEKRARIMSVGFTRVFVYTGGLYLWIANWSFLSREQFPIYVSPTLHMDLQSYRPPKKAPVDSDPQEVWDSWQRFLGNRLLQNIDLTLNNHLR